MSDEDQLMDEIVAVVSNFTPEELERFAKLRDMTAEEWKQIIANWKAERCHEHGAHSTFNSPKLWSFVEQGVNESRERRVWSTVTR
jgi:hypothetical protein